MAERKRRTSQSSAPSWMRPQPASGYGSGDWREPGWAQVGVNGPLPTSPRCPSCRDCRTSCCQAGWGLSPRVLSVAQPLSLSL